MIYSINPTIKFPMCLDNKEDFDWLFKSYFAPLCFFCENITEDEAAASDIVTELFMGLWEKKKRFDTLAHAKAFLYHAAKNASINNVKYKKSIATKHDLLAGKSPVPETDYLDEMIATEFWAEVYRAIEGLPTQCAKVISMSYLDGKTNNEIADELGISLQTVKNHKFRGIQKLKDSLPENMILLLLIHRFLD